MAGPLGRGYRSWKVGYLEEEKELPGGLGARIKTREPRLYAVTRDEPWVVTGPGGEVRSDWTPEEPFESTSKGIYSKSSLKDLKGSGYVSDVVGALLPYGNVAEGSTGWRAEKVKVSELFKNIPFCFACGKEEPRHWVVTKSGRKYQLCDTCRRRLGKLIEKVGLEEVDWEDLLKKLAEYYDAEVVEAEGW